MADFADQLVAGFDRDLEAGWKLVVDTYVEAIKRDAATPRKTGGLAGDISAVASRVNAGRATADINSTHRTERGADLGTILDRSTGRVVEASDYGKRAFGPINPPVGGLRFLPRFKVTTAHVGWWTAANRAEHWRAALDQLAKVDL